MADTSNDFERQDASDRDRKDEGNLIETRSVRFVDTSQDQLLKSGNINDLNCFYQGDLVHERMSAVRRSIYHIRKNWSNFDHFMLQLKAFMEKEAADGHLSNEALGIFSRKRNWCDLEKSEENFSTLEEEFNVIHAYTTKQGFKEIFKVSDGIFRRDSSVDYEELVTNAVFLIELINIDLFNFVCKNPSYQKFEGVVYRGMAIPTSLITTFNSLVKQPINKRYISIPLGLWSASLDLQQAIIFVKSQLDNNPSNIPLLMRIHVLNLNEDHLKFYQNKFQEKSVVSTICAVNITEMSHYKHEAEVLLRGGFYQTLNIYNAKMSEIDFCVLDMVMLNTNRDHMSTSTLLNETEDAEARALFGTMVGVTRNKFIVDYCEKKELFDDLEKYKVLLKESEEKLSKLMAS